MSSLQPPTRVILWTAPRCLSSAFERSVRELKSVKVLYEPHLHSFYHGPERNVEDPNDPERLEPKYASYTYDFADEKMIADYDDYSAVFVKNMVHYVPRERVLKYMEGKFLDFKHSILIRNPCKAIPSQWKAVMRCGFHHYDRDTFLRLWELFDCARSMGKDVTIIDSADLLNNPEGIMKKYCAETGLTYDDKMLNWSPGVVEDWAEHSKYYKEWHWNAMYSSGFDKTIPKDASRYTENTSTESFPSDVEEEIKNAMAYYAILFEHRMLP